MGYEVVGAEDGEEAWRKFLLGSEQDGFYAVITDYQMPKMDGLKLTKLIRGVDQSVRIILCSVVPITPLQGVNFVGKTPQSNFLQRILSAL